MSMCPMADTCKGMMENPLSGLVMLVPGIAFVALGILIIVWPSVLAWLVAAACNLVRRISSRFKVMREDASSA
jgi:hypothetical protein